MRQVSYRETRQQGLSQDIPLKLDLYRKCKVPLSACWAGLISSVWAEPVTNSTFRAGCAQGKPFGFSSCSRVCAGCGAGGPRELLQPDSVGIALVCSKILEVEGAERYQGTPKVFFCKSIYKVARNNMECWPGWEQFLGLKLPAQYW